MGTTAHSVALGATNRRNILAFGQKWMAEYGVPPTAAESARQLGMCAKTALAHINDLKADGEWPDTPRQPRVSLRTKQQQAQRLAQAALSARGLR